MDDVRAFMERYLDRDRQILAERLQRISDRVAEMRSLPKGIEAKLEPINEGREYQVRVVVNPGLPKGPFTGKLTIHTDSPKVPTLEVEFKGIVI